MRAVASRVTRAEVTVDGTAVGKLTAPGLLVLLGVATHDTPAVAAAMAAKLYRLRVLRGELSCADTGAGLLVVSQFTLYGDTRKGRRPSWSRAAGAPAAQALLDDVVAELRFRGATVACGRFGADMAVHSINDGPFTVLLET
jgi:D-tyrosyl-tRNA(Tyr) deacylase